MTKPYLAGESGTGGGRPAFEIRKSFWGYVIQGTGGPPMMLQVAQGVVLAFGAAFTAASLLLVTTASGAEGLSAMRSGLSAVLASFALLLIWFATRGGMVELQVDLARGELRELVRHRMGRATVLGRHGFDGSATLRIDRSGGPDAPCALILKLRGDGESLCIARGPEPVLQELRRRLAQDLRLRDLAAPSKPETVRAAA